MLELSDEQVLGLPSPDGGLSVAPISSLEINHSPSYADGGVSVVLPCLNEQSSVGLVVHEALRAMASAGIQGEVLVVDNGSTDQSVDVAKTAGARVVHERRRGYGRALRTGISAANYPIVVIADADFTYDMSKLAVLVEPVRSDKADIAIGSRLHEANLQNMPLLHRYVGTPALTALVRQAGGLRSLPDSQSGFRCFRKDTINRLNLRSEGMEFASEMLIKGSHRRLRVIDVPTGYRTRIGDSKLNTFSDGWRHLRLIVLLAPELLLIAPGLFLFGIGTALSVAAFLPSRGIEIGSLRWQPIFFASIALVMGLQSILVGLTFVWRRSAMTGTPIGSRLAFIRNQRFPRRCTIVGVAAITAGLALDALLFIQWVGGSGAASTDLSVASLAQSLLLMGGSLVSFGLVVMWLHWDERENRSTSAS